jgi:3-phenylpropionate/trans-cinnamate dioxygenase ferredoxin reductase subunit
MSGAGVVIVGGGLGAVRTAQALRDVGFDGPVSLVSEEAVLPYDRPPLSKAFLLGMAGDEDVTLVSEDELDRLGVDVRLLARAVALDRTARRVRLEGGDEIAYDRLVVATGARPNRLRLAEGRADVLYLRNVEDARRLRGALVRRPRVGIVGGGFIGLEVAAAALALGCDVTVIEAASAPLAPVLGPALGGWVQEWHEEHGVRFLCGAGLAGIEGDGAPARLTLSDGRAIDVEVVVVGVGVTPEVAWLRDAGLEVHRGLVCDDEGRTSDPHVFGVGDVTCRHRDGTCRPSGHWTAAGEHAGVVAGVIAGDAGAGALPVQEGYFWSDQFDRRLQFTGTVGAAPAVRVLHGAVEDRAFVALLEDADQVTGVFGMGSAREFVKASLALRRGGLTAGAAEN